MNRVFPWARLPMCFPRQGSICDSSICSSLHPRAAEASANWYPLPLGKIDGLGLPAEAAMRAAKLLDKDYPVGLPPTTPRRVQR